MSTLITSAGILRDIDRPRVGVTSIHRIESWVIDEHIDQGIDLSYEQAITDLRNEIEADFILTNNESDNPVPNDELQEMIDEKLQGRLDDGEFDLMDRGREILFGDWEQADDGRYQINTNGSCGFAAVYDSDSGNICVEYSKTVTHCHHTSPCYVMADGRGPCGDLDSIGDSVLAYTLPAEYFRSEED